MTDGNNANSATERVFNTFELVEGILLNICDPESRDTEFRANARKEPRSVLSRIRNLKEYRHGQLKAMMKQNKRAHAQELRDLFRMQAVNTTFRNVIAGSKDLRRQMFRDTGITQIKKLQSDFWSDEDELLRYLNPIAFELEKIVSFRAFLVEYLPLDDGDPSRGSDSDGEDVDVEGYRLRKLNVTVIVDVAFEEPAKSASWRNMLFAQGSMDCQVRFHICAGGLVRGAHTAKLLEGATLGQFVDIAVEAIKTKAGNKLELSVAHRSR